MYKFILSGFIYFLLTTNVYAECYLEEDVQQERICPETEVSNDTVIEAFHITPLENNTYQLDGDICISMQDQKVKTEKINYDDKNGIIDIQTPLIYQDKKQTINAAGAVMDTNNEKTELSQISYFVHDTKANGEADAVNTEKNRSHLKSMTYTTCPANDKQWYIKAKSAELDSETQIGKFRKTTLYFKDVPILHLPYAKLPLANQRMTGFLIPEVRNSSRSGFDLALPYYINIAENMDATITPRYMTDRGAMLSAEYRYLGQDYAGELSGSYMSNDKEFDDNRGYLEFSHSQRLGKNWAFNTKLANVSDNQFFEDFGNNIYATSQSYLYSFLNFKGFGEQWKFAASFDDYQIISESIPLNRQPYQTLPEISYSWFNNSLTSTLNYGVDVQWSGFYRDDSITANRLDAIPYLQKTFQNNYSKLTPRLAYRYTNWSYSDLEFSDTEFLKENRALPIASLDYSIYFEKQNDDGGFSSLEPRLYYLRVPYEDQSDIPLFDTHELTFGRSILFQENSFSGADRQTDANQLSVGLTQRNFDANGDEKWNLTVGQIRYFSDRKVALDDTIETSNSSPIISEFNYFYRNWKLTMSLNWDTELDDSERALVRIQHKAKNNSVFNFAYRYRRGKIEQLDSSVVLPIGLNNRFIARWNYSLDANQTIEAIAGIEHKNCCWATRLVARRYVYNEQGDVNNGIYFELQLNSMGALGRNPRRLLKQSIMGYSEEF